ncbi:MAG: ASKHA domain-containing protein [Candidatus Saganbacteria bacterium]|nr:ASKHA domain-containing protein [Candidatus Saganbacteria bacterium]
MANLGLAVDIGSTNIAGFMIDLDKRKDHFSLSIKNSQASHGSDVVSRLTFASQKQDNVKALQKQVVTDLNNLIFALSKRLHINRKRLSKIIVSGNTIMLHLLLGLDISGFLKYPFKSEIKGPVEINAEEIGVVASKKTKLITLSVISPYVGADVVSGILYTGMHKLSGRKLLIDLGTNAEIVLGNKDRLIAASAAAGPAFKGKDIVLGSEIISSVARMLKNGLIDKNGNLKQSKGNPLPLGEGKGEGCKVLSQDDIRSFQLAKGAVRAGIEILMEKYGINLSDVKKILIAGLFGKKIDRQDAITTGLIPSVPRTTVRAIGNSSLGGAKKVLLDPGLLEEVKQIAKTAEPVELSLEKGYQERFIFRINFD